MSNQAHNYELQREADSGNVVIALVLLGSVLTIGVGIGLALSFVF